MADIEVLGTDHPQALDRAISILQGGGLIALPTDTVYGLAADAWNGQAVSKLYEVKSRSELKSVPVLVSGEAAIEEVAARPSERVRALAAEFWPGALTMVVERKIELPSEVSATGTVGLRAPDHEFALTLIRKFGPLAVTSANRSGQPNSTAAVQVIETLSGRVDLVVDGGEIAGGVPSTVVDLTISPPALLRQGPISIESVLRVWESY
ncbi:MAG: L-threonylcarbamoyladenylate synthase [Anaerolineales bacterium]